MIHCTYGDLDAEVVLGELLERLPKRLSESALDGVLYDVHPARDLAYLDEALRVAEVEGGFYRRTAALVLGLNELPTWNAYTQVTAAEYWTHRAAVRHGLEAARPRRDSVLMIRVLLRRTFPADVRLLSHVIERAYPGASS